MGLLALLHVSVVRGEEFLFILFIQILWSLSPAGDVILLEFAIMFLILFLPGCQRECGKPLEPMGAAVFLWELCTDWEFEPVLHDIVARRAGEAATRAVWGVDRLLHRWNLQYNVASPNQYHRYDPSLLQLELINFQEWCVYGAAWFLLSDWSKNRCLLWSGWPPVPFGGPSVSWPGFDLCASPEANAQQPAGALYSEPENKSARRSPDAAQHLLSTASV